VAKGRPKNFIPESDIRPLAAAFLKGEPVEGEIAVITRQQAEDADYNRLTVANETPSLSASCSWVSSSFARIARRHVAQASILGERFREIALPWPPPAEQHAFARIFYALHASLLVEAQTLETARVLKRAAMRELFTRRSAGRGAEGERDRSGAGELVSRADRGAFLSCVRWHTIASSFGVLVGGNRPLGKNDGSELLRNPEDGRVYHSGWAQRFGRQAAAAGHVTTRNVWPGRHTGKGGDSRS